METSNIIALSSAVVALCALIATGYQIYLSHRHDRLIVEPFPVWSESYLQEDSGTYLVFTLMNHGQGPALMEDRWFELDGNKFESDFNGSDLVEAVTKQVFGQKVLWQLRQSSLCGKTNVLPAGGELVVAKIYFPQRDKDGVRAALATCPEVDLMVVYSSLYKERKRFSALHGIEALKS